MGDENPIRTLGDYSKPSHEGYRNTIELPEGNNVVPLRSDTIRLVQNGCSFHGLRSEDPNQHLKDFLKLVDSLDLNGDNRKRKRLRLFQFSLRDQASNWLERLPAGSISTWEDLTTRESLSGAWTRFKDLLQKVPHHGIELWLQVQIFYDRIDEALKKTIDYAAEGQLRKLSAEKAWATIEKLAQYEDEGWNDPVIPEEGSLDYENPDIEQLLGIMEYKVDTLIKDAISLVGINEGVFRITSNEMYQLPPKPSRQEEFEHIPGAQEDNPPPLKKSHWKKRFGGLGYLKMACTKCAMMLLQDDPFTPGTSLIRNSLLAKALHVYRELVREFFALFEFDASPYMYDPENSGVRFRLGGEQREISLLKLGWRVGLYTKRKSRESVTLSGLSRAETVKESRLLMEFWPNIRDGGFNVGNTKVASIRDPKIKLAHRCIATTIAGRKETTHRVTEIDLYYLYCIYTQEVVCNLPYWLAKYLKGAREKNLICGGMFVTRIAGSFGLLTNEMMDALSVEPLPHVFKKKLLIAMGVIMELHNGVCVWPATRAVEENDEAEEANEGEVGNEGVGGSANMYCNMSQNDWQVRQARWMDQQDEH
ncbi:hypothetical protein Tco_0001816 [Tanacetum coccineum]